VISERQIKGILFFSTNEHGRLTDVLISNMVMSKHYKDKTPDEVLEFYEAFHQLMKLLYAAENIIDIHMQPGQMALYQNTRVLHGRTAIESTGIAAKRWLQISYMDRDTIFSRLRFLHKKLGLKTPYLHEQSNNFF
jgi:alpha-ketoglutarate-dependent taurine dioxygenase